MEVFRLKDSSLLETSISNLEEENDDYLDEKLKSLWNEYFLHMEKLLEMKGSGARMIFLKI